MTTGKRKFALLLAVAAACAAFADNGVTNTFTMTTANTPLTAYDYTRSSYWNNQTLGAPIGGEAKAIFTSATTPYFVKLPADFKTMILQLNKGAFLLGDYLKINSAITGVNAATSGNTEYPYGGIIFGDLKVTRFYSKGTGNWLARLSVAGHIRPGTWDGGTDGDQYYAHTALMVLRHDLFADNANPVREGAYHYSHLFLENGGFMVYGPKGAAANDSSWNLTSGEVYAEYAGTGSHAVVPGQVVTGTGVPAGAFVKYVFPGTKWIALSAAATATASAASLHFDAITPSVSEYWHTYWFSAGASRTWALAKFREEDGLKMAVSRIYISDKGADNQYTRIGLTVDQSREGFIPGDMLVTNVEFRAGVQYRPIQLYTCRIEFVNPFIWDNTLDSYLGPNNIRFELTNAAYVAEIKIPEGKTVDLKAFCNLRGTLVKKGAGTLVVPMFNTDVSGSIEVAEGTVDLRRGTSIAGQPLQLGSLKIAAGATFVVPEGGLTVTSLDAAAGSVISGGNLTVINHPVTALPAMTGGASIAFRFGFSQAEVFPASSLRLHFDASDASSITTNSHGGITRWDDLSGSGDYLEWNARGTVSEYATNRFNTANGLPMVDLGPLCWTNEGPGQASEKDRSFYLKKGDGSGKGYRYEDATNGIPYFPSCQTALCVIDSRHGGGPLIGQSGISGYPDFSPFPCGIRNMADWEDQRDARYYVHSDVKRSSGGWWGANEKFTDATLANGTLIFRVNGTSKNPCTSKFTGGFEIVSYAYESAKYGCFGLGCWGSVSKEYPRTANGLMFGEVVVFSNKLSLAQIELAERYLQKKWAGRDNQTFYDSVTVDAISLGAGSTLSGVNGHAFATAAVSGTGTVAGDLAIEDGGTISVATDASGVIPGMTVAGMLTLGPSFNVAVGGSVRPEIGAYRICSAESVAGTVDPTLLTVTPFPGDTRPYRVVVDANGVVLKVMQSGCRIIFR